MSSSTVLMAILSCLVLVMLLSALVFWLTRVRRRSVQQVSSPSQQSPTQVNPTDKTILLLYLPDDPSALQVHQFKHQLASHCRVAKVNKAFLIASIKKKRLICNIFRSGSWCLRWPVARRTVNGPFTMAEQYYGHQRFASPRHRLSQIAALLHVRLIGN